MFLFAYHEEYSDRDKSAAGATKYNEIRRHFAIALIRPAVPTKRSPLKYSRSHCLRALCSCVSL